MIVREFKPCWVCGGTNIGIVVGPVFEWGKASYRKYALCYINVNEKTGCGQIGPTGDTDDEAGTGWNEMADSHKEKDNG